LWAGFSAGNRAVHLLIASNPQQSWTTTTNFLHAAFEARKVMSATLDPQQESGRLPTKSQKPPQGTIQTGLLSQEAARIFFASK